MAARSKSLIHRLLHFPLTKIIAGIIVVVGMVSLGQFLSGALLSGLNAPPIATKLIKGIITALFALCSYFFLFKFYEKRKITELSFAGAGKSLLGGIFLGAMLQSLTILVIYLVGGFSVLSVNPVACMLPPLIMAFTSAIFEEVIVRGIIFRVMEEKLGSYIALIVSALIFGALHLGNPNSTLLAALGLALQAGLFLAAAFIYSRNLWFPIAIHFAWNFTQAGVFGATVSGNATKRSLLTTKIEGAEWYTGGAFGPEGSVQATVFCLAAAATILLLCRRQNKIIPPSWKKQNSLHAC